MLYALCNLVHLFLEAINNLKCMLWIQILLWFKEGGMLIVRSIRVFQDIFTSYLLYQQVSSVGWYCFLCGWCWEFNSPTESTSHMAGIVGLIPARWVLSQYHGYRLYGLWTLVVPPIRYQSMANSYVDSQVVEIWVCLMVGRGLTPLLDAT